MICMITGLLVSGKQNVNAAVATTKDFGSGTNASGRLKKQIMKANSAFSVQTELGMNGYGVYGRPLQIKIALESEKDFEGEVRIIPYSGDTSQIVVAQGKDVTLSAGEQKEISVVLSTAGYIGTYLVQIINAEGKVIYSEKDKFSLSDCGNTLKIGILSDYYSALRYFDNLSLWLDGYEGITGIMELTTDIMPEDSNVLSLFSYIVIDNYDTAQLSEAQCAALKEWVNKGGVLILGTGDSYQKVIRGFGDDFVSGTFKKINRQNLKEYKDGEVITIEDVDCVEFTLEGGQPLNMLFPGNTAFYKKTGDGILAVLSFSLSTQPIAGYEENAALASGLLQKTKSTKTVDIMNGNTYDGGAAYSCYSIARLTDDGKKPSRWLYGIILSLYVIIVGPVLYLVLKLVKQREKIWIAIPAVAVAFTGIIYGTGFLYRVNVPIVDTVSLISLSDGQQTERAYTYITFPKVMDYTIQLNPSFSSVAYDTDSYSYGLFGTRHIKNGTYDYLIKDSDKGKNLTFHNEEIFHSNTFTAVRSGENTMGKLTYDLECTTTGFTGSVTNNTRYDLEEVVVTFENHIYVAGDVKAGETVTIDPDRLVTSEGYGTFDEMYKGASQNQKGNLYSQIDSMMENYFMKVSQYGRGMIWAMIDHYAPEDYVVNTKVKSSGVGVVYQTFEAEYADVSGVYYSSIIPMITDMNGNYFDMYDGMLYGDSAEVTYSFAGYPGITELQIVPGQEKSEDKDYATVYAYNPATKDYDEIFVDSNRLSGSDFCRYVVDNTLKLRFEYDSSQDGTQGYVPRICARGDE